MAFACKKSFYCAFFGRKKRYEKTVPRGPERASSRLFGFSDDGFFIVPPTRVSIMKRFSYRVLHTRKQSDFAGGVVFQLPGELRQVPQGDMQL